MTESITGSPFCWKKTAIYLPYHSAVLAEISAVLVKNSAVLVDFASASLAVNQN